MSPTIVEDAAGAFVLSVSSAGGSRIISAIAQVIRNTVDFGFGALEALAAPRLHDQIYPPVLAMEHDMPTLGFTGFVCPALWDLTKRWR
jgi:gamma-glutamyltranspeptidase